MQARLPPGVAIIEKIDPQTYPFRDVIEKTKHLDTDEERHKIQPVTFEIGKDFAGKEHLYCDKSQLDKDGKFRVPKVIQEMKALGMSTLAEYYESKKNKEKQDMEQKFQDQASTIATLQAQLSKQQEMLNAVVKHIQSSR